MNNKSIPVEGPANQPLFQLVESGIYRKTTNGIYYERPHLNGKRTWRSLETANLKHAREAFYKRRAAPKNDPAEYAVPASLTVGELINRYLRDECLDKHLSKRTGRTLECELAHSKMLLKFWGSVLFSRVSDIECDKYAEWRKKRTRRGSGERMIDRELSTLNNALRYAKRRALIRFNPLLDRPKFQTAKMIHHCREFMPGDANELHACAALMMEKKVTRVFGFQLLFEAMTGLRTCEILRLRTAATPDEAGFVTPDGKNLRVWRCKGQHAVNPFVRVHEGLAKLLEEHHKWKQEFYPDSPWYFPSPRGVDGPVDKKALAQVLLRLRETQKIKKITSHAMRAFYVTVRRSHGATDPQIAFEIGHSSGGITLAAVYGGVPPHWLTDGPKMSWLPIDGQPAWEAIKSKPTTPPHPAQNSDVPAACPPPVSAPCNEASLEPNRPATESNGVQSCPPTPKSSGLPPVEITKCSYFNVPFTHN